MMCQCCGSVGARGNGGEGKNGVGADDQAGRTSGRPVPSAARRRRRRGPAAGRAPHQEEAPPSRRTGLFGCFSLTSLCQRRAGAQPYTSICDSLVVQLWRLRVSAGSVAFALCCCFASPKAWIADPNRA